MHGSAITKGIPLTSVFDQTCASQSDRSTPRVNEILSFPPVRIRWTVGRLNSVLKTCLPSAFRRWSPMGPPAASYVPRVSSRNGEHSLQFRRRVMGLGIKEVLTTPQTPLAKSVRGTAHRLSHARVPGSCS